MRRGVPISRIVAPATVGIDTPGIDSYRSSLVRAGHRRDAPARGPSSIARRTSGASLLRRPTSLTIRSGSPRVPASWRDGRPGHRARARASSPSGGRRGRAHAPGRMHAPGRAHAPGRMHAPGPRPADPPAGRAARPPGAAAAPRPRAWSVLDAPPTAPAAPVRWSWSPSSRDSCLMRPETRPWWQGLACIRVAPTAALRSCSRRGPGRADRSAVSCRWA